MTEGDEEVRRQRIATGAKWAIGLVGAAIVSPIVFLAVKGIIGLALAVASGYLVIELAPWFGMKVANWRVKLITAEASANPIETMKSLWVEKADELSQADQNIVDFETEIANFADQVGGFKKQYPDEAATYETLLSRMRDALGEMKIQQSQAREDLKEFQAKIKKAEAIYKMSLAAQKVTKLSKSAEAQVFAQIREQVAFDSVRSQLNKSFASLSLALERRADTRGAVALPPGSSISPKAHLAPPTKANP